MNTKLFIFVAFFFIFACAFAFDFNDDQEFGNIEEGNVANLTASSRVKRADKGCSTLIPGCVQTMCNQCCNKGCKGQDCWQPMCSLCCS